MVKIKTREILPEFHGMKDVTKFTYMNGAVVYLTNFRIFSDEAQKKGACKLNVAENASGFYMHLFNSDNETVGIYKMMRRLHGFTAAELVNQRNRLFFCEKYNQEKGFWETYVYGTVVKAKIYKEGCGLATILKDEKWSVINRNNIYVIPPGKYDYIDGFDKCGLARVKLDGKVNIIEPSKSTKDRWGIIDTKGNEVLPLIYSEIWAFYNKGRRSTTVYKGCEEDGVYYTRAIKYRFEFSSHQLVDVDKEEFDRNLAANIKDNYSIWDALDGEPEAAGNIDYEW